MPAAGRAERFGGEKLLARWHDRELLGHVLLKLGGARAAGLLGPTIVVHRPEDDAVRALAGEYRCHAEAMRVNDGDLSLTLRTGIESIKGRVSSDTQQAILICLADQPMLRLDVIKAMVETWARIGAVAVRPAYRDAPDEPGHPLLVDRSLWHLADEMRGDSGLAPVLAAHRIGVRTIPVAGTNPDVDTPEDLKRLDHEHKATA
ncbi:MAG TPA: NTP transferase domain-containing protein [Gemmatimonadales bacterium]|nr:NTP transferase domain-containing protein [Gemmatimonadales bacterium]